MLTDDQQLELARGGLDSTPELNPMPQTGKGGTSMKNGPVQLSRQLRRVSIAMGYALARFYRLCCRIRCTGESWGQIFILRVSPLHPLFGAGED